MKSSILPILGLSIILGACSVEESGATAISSLDPDPVLEIGGDRPAKVILPESYSLAKRYPIVVMLHGYSANAGTQNIIFQLKERVDEREFILILPEGTRDNGGKQFWNATPECCDFDAKRVNDVTYLSDLIDEALALYAANPAKVNFVGHSNGGYMSYRLACEIPEKLNRIAVLAGSVFLDEKACVGKKSVSVLHMHGTADDVVPYGEMLDDPADGAFRVKTVGAEAAVSRWRAKAGCDTELKNTGTFDFLSGRAGNETEVLIATGCADDTKIELWRMNEGDHLLLDANNAWRDRVADFLLE